MARSRISRGEHTLPTRSHDRLYAVLGYGCTLSPALVGYLDAVAMDLTRKPRDERALLWTSGGFTQQRSAPGLSEARLLAHELHARGVRLEVELDEAARTTLENLRGLATAAQRHGLSAAQIVICCDGTRRAKIRWVARRLLGGEPALWCYDLQRSTTHALTQASLGLAYDAAALRLSWLERAGLGWVDQRMKTS